MVELKFVDYLLVQADKPWYKYNIPDITGRYHQVSSNENPGSNLGF